MQRKRSSWDEFEKKKKEKENSRKEESARYARCFLRMNPARCRRQKFHRAFTRPSLIRRGKSINLDLCLNPTIWLASPTTAISSSPLFFFLSIFLFLEIIVIGWR